MIWAVSLLRLWMTNKEIEWPENEMVEKCDYKIITNESEVLHVSEKGKLSIGIIQTQWLNSST